MTDQLVKLEIADEIATLTIDDGKANALNPAMFDAIYAAIDEAEAAEAALLITGREGILSAGFDLKVMKGGGVQAVKMLRAGYSLTARLLAYPRPVIIASSGHAYAMGAFMLLSGDYRIGITGDFVYTANEVAIGLPMPRTGAEVLRLRLTPAARERAVVLAEHFDPESALSVGFIDALVAPEDLMATARAKATELLALDREAHMVSKRRLRAQTIETIRVGIRRDLADAVAIGAKRMIAARRKG